MVRSAVVLFFAAALCLSASGADAGSKGRLIGALADYDDYKKSTRHLLQEADNNRAQSYSTDTKEMIRLYEEIAKLRSDVFRFYGEELQKEIRTRVPLKQSMVLFAVHEALDWMAHALMLEISYQQGQKTSFVVVMRWKTEDLFRIADEEVLKVVAEQTKP